MSSFLERRKAQLTQEGRNDLAAGIDERVAEAPIEVSSDKFSDSDFSVGEGILVQNREGDASLRETITFVLKTLDSLPFDMSPATQANAERAVRDMSSEECEDALRSATTSGLLSKPVYYSILVDRVRRESENAYRILVEQVVSLEELFDRYFPAGVLEKLEDKEKVPRMTHAELRSAASSVTADDVRNRGGFYRALLDRLMKEI